MQNELKYQDCICCATRCVARSLNKKNSHQSNA